MTWAKLDDAILDNPKVVQVGVLGFAWYAAGLVYANRNLTDGFIPFGMADRLLGPSVVEADGKIVTVGVTCGMQGEDMPPRRIIGWLLTAGLWHQVDRGYMIHDFLDHNPSRAKVLKERESWVNRQTRHRSRRDTMRDNNGDSSSDSPIESRRDHPVTHASPVPVPVLVKKETTLARPRRATVDLEGFAEFWEAYPKKRGKGDAERAWRQLGLGDGPSATDPLYMRPTNIIATVQAHARSPDWLRDHGQFIPYPATWLRRRGWEDELEIAKPPPPVPATVITRAAVEAELAEQRAAKGGGS